MTRGRVFIATSLDGFIARRDGGLDWLPGLAADGGDYGYAAFMETVDGLVMGRNSFETVAGFDPWPYDKPVVVLSRSLGPQDVPAHLAGHVRLSSESPREIMARLSTEGWRAAYIDGGRVIQSFLREGLIEDMTITRVPVLLGEGISLFGPTGADLRFRHEKTEAFRSGLVQSQYRLMP